MLPLLAPNDPELTELVTNRVSREIYRVLFENRSTPLDIHEIRGRIDFEALGSDDGQQHLDRRLRDLDATFRVLRERRGSRSTYYRLVGRLDVPRGARGRIDKRTRAWVLRDQRCAQCGRTPSVDGVRLHVDHKIPQTWGGTNDPENLQALCSECNEGKKDYFVSLGGDVASEVLAAAAYEEPQRRIGEALKAAYPHPVRDDVLERIAGAKTFQADWQKRLRELRQLGWKITYSKRRERGRFVVYYVLHEDPPPWPENIAAELRRGASSLGIPERRTKPTNP